MEYVSKVTLSVDGQEITDFNKITEPEVEYRVPVNLMNKNGFVSKKPRYSPIKVEYIVPSDAPEFNFADVKGATLIIRYENNTQRTYRGVSTLKVGGETYDAEGKEVVRTVELMAEDRDPK